MSDLRFGCETARKRLLRVNGLDLSFLEWGESGNPALCFLHGGAAHAHWFDLVAPAFASRFRVISLVVLGANLLGDGLRDLLDPRLG